MTTNPGETSADNQHQVGNRTYPLGWMSGINIFRDLQLIRVQDWRLRRLPRDPLLTQILLRNVIFRRTAVIAPRADFAFGQGVDFELAVLASCAPARSAVGHALLLKTASDPETSIRPRRKCSHDWDSMRRATKPHERRARRGRNSLSNCDGEVVITESIKRPFEQPGTALLRFEAALNCAKWQNQKL
jgi:hypothetical protein